MNFRGVSNNTVDAVVWRSKIFYTLTEHHIIYQPLETHSSLAEGADPTKGVGTQKVLFL